MNNSVSIKVMADISDYRAKMAQIASSAKAAKREVGDISKKIFDDIRAETARTVDFISRHKVGFAAIATAVTGAAAAVVSLTRSAANYNDEILKSSQRTGVALQSVAGLRLAAETAGVSFTELDRALMQVSQTTVRAASGNESARAVFASLGISIRDQNGELLKADEILAAVADKFQRMPDGVVKTSAAMRLFNESGARLIPMLNEGREGIAKYSAEAAKLGLVVSPQLARASQEFNDNLTRLNKSIEATKISIGNQFIPVATRLLDILGRLRGIELEGAPARALERSLELLDRRIEIAQQRLEQLGNNPALARQREPDRIMLEGLRRERADLGEQLDRLQSAGTRPPGTESTPIVDAGVTKTKNEFQSFLDGLRRDISEARAELIELSEGPAAGLRTKILAQFELQGFDKIPGARQQVESLVAELAKLSDELAAQSEGQKLMEGRFKDLFGEIDAAEERAIDTGREFVGVFAELETMGLTPTEKALREINSRFGEMRAKVEAFGQASGQIFGPDSDIMQRLEFFRRQEILKAQPPTWTAGFDAMDEPIDTKAAEKFRREWFQIGDAISGVFSDLNSGMLGVVQGTTTVSDAFERMALNVISRVQSMVTEILIVEPILEHLKKMLTTTTNANTSTSSGTGIFASIADFIAKFFSFEQGGIMPLRHGPIYGLAAGGILKRPAFTFGHGGATVLMGENAPRQYEAVVPLPDNRHIPAMVTMPPSDGVQFTQEVIINNNTNTEVRSERRRMGDTEQLILTIGEAVARDVRSGRGPVSRALTERYDVHRVPMKR